MWMTIDEVADYLRVSKETIYKMAQQHRIPGSKLGNQWRFKKELVDVWLENQASTTATTPSDVNPECKEA